MQQRKTYTYGCRKCSRVTSTTSEELRNIGICGRCRREELIRRNKKKVI